MGFLTEVIEHGYITSKQELTEHYYIIRVLDKGDVMEVLELQNYVLEQTEQKSSCVPLSIEEHQSIINGNGEAIGLFIQNKLYAVCSILFPGSHEINMARELNFGYQELQQVSQLELSLVHPDLRGHKLQQKLAGMLADRAEKKKKCRYLFTTVSPYNYPSIQTVTSMGMRIAKLCKMYYGWDRYVVYKDFVHPIRLDLGNSINIANTDFDQQYAFLNCGYLGFSQFKDEKGIKIIFAKRIITK